MSKRNHNKAGFMPPPDPLLTMRLLVLATVSILAGLVAGALTWKATQNPWLGALALLGTAGTTLDRLQKWTGP